MTTYYPQLLTSRILLDLDRTTLTSDDGDVVTLQKGTKIIIACQIGYNQKDTAASSFKLRWRNVTDGGSFADVGATGECKYSATSSTLVDGAAVTALTARCSIKSDQTWQNGLENVNDNLLPDSGTLDLASDSYTELQWAVDLSDGLEGKQYEWQLWNNTSGVATGTVGAQVTTSRNLFLVAGTGVYTETGADAIIGKHYTITAGLGGYAEIGADVTLNYTVTEGPHYYFGVPDGNQMVFGIPVDGQMQFGWVTEGPGPPGVTYLLNDTFTTDRAAGAVNGTAPEPGPGGNRTVTTTNGTITSGYAVLITSEVSTWQNWLYSAQSRVLGQVLLAELTNVNVSSTDANTIHVGLFSTNDEAISFQGVDSLLRITEAGIAITIDSSPTQTQSANIAIVQRAYGNFWFYKPPGGSNWLLKYISDLSNQASLTPGYKINSESSNTWNKSAFIEFASSWWPLPVVSDAFSGSWGTTDGQGHFGANNSGEGVGGGSLAWNTETGGTIGITSGKAKASALDSSAVAHAAAYTSTSTADVVVEMNLTGVAADGHGAYLRRSNATNFVAVLVYPTSVHIYKVVNDSYTEIGTGGSITFGDGKRFMVSVSGNDYRLYYDDALVAVGSDSFNSTATSHGIYFLNTTAQIDNFALYPFGTGGEYNTDLNNLLGE